MTEIKEHCLRIDAVCYPFHSGYTGISRAKVRGQGYYGTHPQLPERLFISWKAPPIIPGSQLLRYFEGYNGDSNEQDYQGDGKLK